MRWNYFLHITAYTARESTPKVLNDILEIAENRKQPYKRFKFHVWKNWTTDCAKFRVFWLEI
jgi:hypothetical protein